MRRTRPLFTLLLLAAFSLTLGAEPLVHVLQKGETVYGVARIYSVPPEAIIAVNGIGDPRRVLPGTRLVIPASHKVSRGETLFGIARSRGIPLEALLAANKLSAGAVIRPGDILLIPGTVPRPLPPRPSTGPAAEEGKSTPQAQRPAAPTPGTVPAAGTPPAARPIARPPSGGAWPAEGQAVYLEGKLFGIGIRTEENARIRAVRSGTVISAGPFRGYGQVAFVQAKDGLIYVYGGARTLMVRIGEAVRPGTEIGRVGMDLLEGRPIAYFLVFRDGIPLDPATVPRE
ncbi:MAG TPA: LysM peptidoglycan-binding domain-containing protein [Magnetospirillaceae bacterium]|nr:LysM peptidoglycan-binding domain-containing protein [Magnetospirillaceae bacterium]